MKSPMSSKTVTCKHRKLALKLRFKLTGRGGLCRRVCSWWGLPAGCTRVHLSFAWRLPRAGSRRLPWHCIFRRLKVWFHDVENSFWWNNGEWKELSVQNHFNPETGTKVTSCTSSEHYRWPITTAILTK